MTDPATNTNLIKHLHTFRGFSIVMIVAAHSWSYLASQIVSEPTSSATELISCLSR